MVGGPSSPAECTHTSSRPHAFKMSSMSIKVASSEETFSGYPMTLVFGKALETSAANAPASLDEVVSQAT